MAVTFADIATEAYGDIGVLADGEVMTASQATRALNKGNGLLDQWKLEPLTFYSWVRTLLTIVASDGEYTVGSGGNVNIERPASMDRIAAVHLVDTTPNPDQERPLHPLTEAEYRGLYAKALTSTQPSAWYYNPTYPLGTLTLWPTPTSAVLQAAIYVPTAVPEFAAITTTFALPPGYRRMLVTNLALELLPSNQRDAHPQLVRAAAESKAAVKRGNERAQVMQFPSEALIGSGGGSYDILAGP